MERFILNKLCQYKILSLRVLLTLAQVDTKSPFKPQTIHRDLIATLMTLEKSGQITWDGKGIRCSD